MISVLILTFNEERNIAACMASVSWSDDIVVVDSFSTDRTVEIAASLGARVLQRRFDDFAGQRNYGIAHGAMRHDWVLHLDADEIVTPELRDEMLAAAASATCDAYRLPSKMMFRGRWLRYAGMYPTYQTRFGHRERLRFRQVGHGQREDLPPERLGTLRHPLLHYSFSKGIAEWIDKHNRYSTAEAERAIASRAQGIGAPLRGLMNRDRVTRRRAAKDLTSWLPGRAPLRFFYMYVLRRGFLDGAAGYAYCRMLATYELMIDLKLSELRGERAHS